MTSYEILGTCGSYWKRDVTELRRHGAQLALGLPLPVSGRHAIAC